jgi:hypothetical protein
MYQSYMLNKQMKTGLFVLLACIAVGAGLLTGCLPGGSDPTEDEKPVEEQPVEKGRGSGTAFDPYIITTAQHLNDLRNYLGKDYAGTHFKLGKDIDVSSFSEQTWGEEGWEPIGSSSNRFFGHLDGDDHKVTGLWIDRDKNYMGLFGAVGEGGVIEYLGVEVKTRSSVKGSGRVGILAGDNSGSIANCYANGTVTGNENVGGLVGYNSGSITDSSADGDVKATTGSASARVYVGGLAGYHSGSITNSFSGGDVTATGGFVAYAGGLAGYGENCSIANSYATGEIACRATSEIMSYAGGLVAYGDNVSISNCYATGNVASGLTAGGLAGGLKSKSQISSSYATGNVDESFLSGGLVGSNSDNASISNCYFLKEKGGVNSGLTGTSTGSEAGITGKTTAQMKARSTFSGFDFTIIWRINEGKSYPYLRDIEANVENPPGK